MHTTAPILAAALLLLPACCAGDSDYEDWTAASLTSGLNKGCETVLTPHGDAKLTTEVERAAKRWSHATGCDIHVGEAGVGIWVSDEPVLVRNGQQFAGLTGYTATGELAMVVIPGRNERVVIHEMGHVLNPRKIGGRDPRKGHIEAASGTTECLPLMCDNAGRGRITAADLDYVCEDYPCADYVPEVDSASEQQSR